MEKVKLHQEKIYKVQWDGSIWLVAEESECIKEARRLRVLHPSDVIAVIEKVVTVNVIGY